VPALLAALAQLMAKVNGRLILIGARHLDVDLIPAAAIRRLPVTGLPVDHRVVLLDYHLRRAGLDPNDYAPETRKLIADTLGGHPGAIVLAAEFVYRRGIEEVAEDLGKRRGVHEEIVRRILKKTRFTDQESQVLGALSLARVPIPAQLLNKVVSFNALPVARRLIEACLIERSREDYIRIADLIRGFAEFSASASSVAKQFHEEAAKLFSDLAAQGSSVHHLEWAVEARYHAHLCGEPGLAPAVQALSDGALGAARSLIHDKRFEQAKPVIDSLLATHRTAEVCELAAIVYARLGLCDDALTLAKESASLGRRGAWALGQVALLSLHVHRDDVAADAVRIAKGLGCDSSFLGTLEGRICLKRKDLDSAINAFQRAVALGESDPRNADAWPHFYLGRTLLQLGRVCDAIDVLFRGEELASSGRLARRRPVGALQTWLTIAYFASGDIENARRYLAMLAKGSLRNPEVARAAALLEAAEGIDDEDIVLKALARLDPSTAKDRYDRSQVHLFRGLFLLRIGYRERASAEFRSAHEADPRNVFVLLKWSRTLTEIAHDLTVAGEYEASRYSAEHAKTVAEKVLSFDRDNVEALQLLEKISDDFNVQ